MLKIARGWFAQASWPSLITSCCAIGLALGVKEFYSNANATQLLWILAPSAWLARFVGGMDLVYEPGAGFISHAYRMVVGPPCAGINFLVICFLTLYFSFGRRVPRKAQWLLVAVILSFGATILANGLRIVVTAHLWNADIYGGWMTPERMHRLAGTAIYYASLLAVYVVVNSRFNTKGQPSAVPFAPLFWYLGISLGVPLAGRIVAGGSAGFAEHAVWVAGIALVLSLFMFLPPLLRNRVFWRP